MNEKARGFSLIELVTVMILLGIVSITLFSRLSSIGTAAVQAGRDDLIAALFFAQQTAMMRPNISVVITATSVSVNDNNTPIKVGYDFYPLQMPTGVTLSTLPPLPTILTYDKLGRTTATTISLTGSGNSNGVSAVVEVAASGYAYAN